jgi:GTP-binding protein Era
MAREDIEDMLQSKVNLQLWVKVKEGWRDSEAKLKQLGIN